VVWVARERQRVLEAREAALRAVVLAERDRAQAIAARFQEVLHAQRDAAPKTAADSDSQVGSNPSGSVDLPANRLQSASLSEVEQLRRENAELKKTVDVLRQEIERLKATKQH
jgi:hypothetical protein